MTDMPQIRTDFAWPIYADATLAGLATLVPVPLVDWGLEEQFRRRMPAAIARYNGQTLPPPIGEALNGPQRGWLATGARFVGKLPLELVKRFSRKVLYVLTLKAASDKLSAYWQRAFLLDYMLNAGHLTSVEAAGQAREAMEQAIGTTPAPLTALARALIQSIPQLLPILRRVRQEENQDVLPEQQAMLQQQWSNYIDFLRSLAAEYEARRAAAA